MAIADRPEGVLLLGLPRSGTTLLRRLVNAHSQIACPSETNVFGAAARFLRSESFAGNPPIGVIGSLAFLGFREDDVMQRLREFALSFHREYASRQNKPIWADKSPLDVFYLAQIELLLRDHVQFVFLHRHPLDFALSLVEFCSKAGGYYPEIHAYIAKNPDPMSAFADMWVEKTAEILDLHARAANAVSLRYEDLVADPENELRRLFDALSVSWEPGIVNRALGQQEDVGLGDWKTYSKSKIDSSSVGKWTRMPSRIIKGLAPKLNPMLEKLGYQTLAAGNAPDQAEVRREYEIGLMLQRLRQTTTGRAATE